MKKFLSALLLIVIFVGSFVAFFPKERLYYFAQEELLSRYSVGILAQRVESNLFSLELKNVKILLSGSQVANMKRFKLSLVEVVADGIGAIGAFREYLPYIKEADAKLKYGKFLLISSNAGEAVGYIDKTGVKIEISLKRDMVPKYSKLLNGLRRVGDKYVFKYNF